MNYRNLFDEEELMSDFSDEDFSLFDVKCGDGFEWQSKCLNEIKDDNNVIISSPTGSGKTRVFLKWASNKSQRPIIITSPIKALSNQRYKELIDMGYCVGLETGDIKILPKNYDFLCCTQEIYTEKYTSISDCSVIIDEIHYIFENFDRSRAYIDGIHNSNAKNLLLCSATFGDVEKFCDYIDKVSGRDFKIFNNNSRITDIHFGGDIIIDDINNAFVVAFSKEGIKIVINMVKQYRNKKSDDDIKKIRELGSVFKIKNDKLIKNMFFGIAEYYGDMLPKEKFFVEKAFEDGFIDTVVGTDALALGVNFPIENVVFAQLAKYYDGPISRNLFDQLSGRAGRKGFFDIGNVYYCSQLGKLIENKDYKVGDLYKKILKSKNEDVFIELSPKIKDLLLKNISLDDEVEYISKFSTVDINKDEVKKNVEGILDYLHNSFENCVLKILNDKINQDSGSNYKLTKYNFPNGMYEKLYGVLMDKKDEFDKFLPKVYFDEYSPDENAFLFSQIVCGVSANKIINDFCYDEGVLNFREALQFRKYIMNLPPQYVHNFDKINSIIKDVDESAIYELNDLKINNNDLSLEDYNG